MAEYIDKWSVINRLIDLENEFQQYKPFHGFEHAMYRKICETEIAIGKMPAADVEPVRHGRWKYYKKQNIAVCTNCSFERDLNLNFGMAVSCPNCGAKMDERKDK